jgi:hypothetical protein
VAADLRLATNSLSAVASNLDDLIKHVAVSRNFNQQQQQQEQQHWQHDAVDDYRAEDDAPPATLRASQRLNLSATQDQLDLRRSNTSSLWSSFET